MSLLPFQRRRSIDKRYNLGLSKKLKSKILPQQTKSKLYNSIIIPILLYGSEKWTMSTSEEQPRR